MNSPYLLGTLLCGLHLLPLYADYTDAPAPMGVDFSVCGNNMVCTDGSTSWEDGPLRCCPYGETSSFCCRKDNPFVCFIKQFAHHVDYQPPNHLPCCYNCPMGTGEYYGITDNAEGGKVEGKSAKPDERANVHSSEGDFNPEHPNRGDVVMKADNNQDTKVTVAANGLTPPPPSAATTPATLDVATPIVEQKPTPSGIAPETIDYSDEDNSAGVFESCKRRDLATYYVDEDTVCCVGAASSQCCLKDRTALCETDAFGAIEPIKALNREVLKEEDFSPECSTRRPPTHMIAFLRPVDRTIPLIATSVRVSQVEGCDVRVLMIVHTNNLPAGYDYGFVVGNSTVCGDASDRSELLVSLPVNMRHERFRVPSAVASVRDLRGETLTVYKVVENKSQPFACGRFL